VSEEIDAGGLLRLDDLNRVWHSFRLAVAAAALISGLLLGVVWQWPGALVAAALATVAVVDALLRRQAPPGSPMPSLLMDVTLVGVAMMVVGLEPSGVAVALLYMLAVPLLFLSWPRALPVMAYALGLSAMAYAGIAVMSAPVQVVDGVVTAIAFVIFGGHTLALLGVVAFGLERAHREGELRLTWERALARCGEALLATMEDGAIDVAIEALLEAVPIQNIFVDENFDSPVLGLSARVTHEVIRPGFADLVSEEIWAEPDTGPAMIHTTLAYADLPTVYAALSRGEASFVVTRQLEGREREIYQDDGCKSELNIPIIVDAEWVGSIGFADYVSEQPWSDEHLQALHTAAAMVGAFWERAAASRRLEDVIAGLEHHHRLEEGIVKTSAALLKSDVGALDEVMANLQAGTGVDLVFVDENFLDPELGLTARLMSYVDSGIDRPHPPAEWREGPCSDLPTTFEGLSRGEVVVIDPRYLEEPERSIYVNEGVKTELKVPISVRGDWQGSLGLTDYREERVWDPFDIELIVTASEMIGSHWERVEAARSMNVRLSYEKALARVSAELLSDGENPLETAFEYLVAATDTDSMWMEMNYVDADQGLSTRIVHEINSPRLDDIVSGTGSDWTGGPFSEAPTAYSFLSRGEPSIIQTVDLSGSERQMYEDDGQKSELVIPMFVFGEWIGAVGFAQYLNSREWADEDISILRTASELIGSYLERQQTGERLQELIDSKDEFIASISHEIRTPLTSVLGFTSLLRDDYEETPENERRELLGLIGVEAQEVSWIVEDLLVFARSDIGTLAAVSVVLDLGEQVASVVAGQHGTAASRASIERNGDRAIGDPGRVRQIIRNLLTNAMKYGGPALRVATASNDRYAMVHVVDDGPGIDEEQSEIVFDAYYRAHQQAGQPGSMGLGLHVSKQLAQLMGGDLTYSRVSDETCFTLSLPIAGRETHTAARTERPLLRTSGGFRGVAPQELGRAL
jgi:signal transduction histidine kinase